MSGMSTEAEYEIVWDGGSWVASVWSGSPENADAELLAQGYGSTPLTAVMDAEARVLRQVRQEAAL